MTPLVTVCIPTWNRSGYVAEAIESCLAQTHRRLQVLVADDCSPDDTADVVGAIRDERVEYFRNERNLGFIGNWNACLARARGDYVKVMGDDDILYPTCIERQLAALREHEPGVGLVCSNYHSIDASGTRLGGRAFGEQAYRLFPRSTVEPGPGFITNYLKHRRRVGLPTAILFPRAVAEEVGPFDTEAGSMADIEYWARICSRRDFLYLDEILCAQRRHPENLSGSLAAEPRFYRSVERLYDTLAGYLPDAVRERETDRLEVRKCLTIARATMGQPGLPTGELLDAYARSRARTQSVAARAGITAIALARHGRPPRLLSRAR